MLCRLTSTLFQYILDALQLWFMCNVMLLVTSPELLYLPCCSICRCLMVAVVNYCVESLLLATPVPATHVICFTSVLFAWPTKQQAVISNCATSCCRMWWFVSQCRICVGPISRIIPELCSDRWIYPRMRRAKCCASKKPFLSEWKHYNDAC